MASKLLLLAATALVSASCATAPLRDAGTALPPAALQWSAAPASVGAVESDWVDAFGDPVLLAFVEEAVLSNPDIAAAIARFDAAQAAARAASASRVPSVNTELEGRRTERSGGASTAYSLGLGATWEADLWGRINDSARAGSLDAAAAAEDLRGARLSIAGLVAKAWFALLEARLQTELAERDVETKQRSLSIVERRFERGVSRSSDVRTFRSALASSEAALASRRNAEASAARVLEILIGRYPANTISQVGDLPDLGPLPGVGAPGDLLARRPDLLAAERRLEAAGLRADIARKALLPRLSFTGSTGAGGPQLEDILNLDDLVTTLVGSLTAPIFRGGSLRAERDRTEAVVRQQLAGYVATTLTAWREAEDAIFADRALDERVRAQRVAFEQAAAAQELVERQYAQGLATIFELLDAQSRRISAESLYISARRDRAANRVDLHLAIAGDFRAEAGTARVTE